MIIIKQHRIYRTDIQSNPNVLYIFGDNLKRTGFGGQALEMRGEPNSFGFATKRKPEYGFEDCYFHDYDEDVLDIVDEELLRLRDRLSLFEAVVIPSEGIGTGLALLPKKAPKLLEYINNQLYNQIHNFNKG